MSREKQIEEMAKIICVFDDEECEHCNICSFHNGCAAEIDAENIYNAGYRKASEVANEFIDWLQANEHINKSKEYRRELCELFLVAELENKYTEGGE